MTPDWHPEDVKAAIRKTGLSCERLSVGLGYGMSSVGIALRRPWPKLEALIARHLGRDAWAIWPSRYDEHGNPLKPPAGGRRPSRSSRATAATNRNKESDA